MLSQNTRNKLSSIKKKICQLRDSQRNLLDTLLKPKAMVIGSYYKVYKTCSNANCCCKHGKKHGPYPALSISLGGKQKIKMVRRGDIAATKRKAQAYQSYQHALARFRKMNKEIDVLLESLKKEFLEEYE